MSKPLSSNNKTTGPGSLNPNNQTDALECQLLTLTEMPFKYQRHQVRKRRVHQSVKRLPDIVSVANVEEILDIEDLVEDTARPSGRHETHDIRGKSSRSLRRDFSANKVNDEFVKTDLEHSLWYAKEFFLKKQDFQKLKEASHELVPYFVNWCRGGNFPTYEKFLRVKGKTVTLRKGGHIKARRIILKALSRQDSTPFSQTVKFYLAGGVKQDKAQGILKFFRKCFGIDAALAYADAYVDAKSSSFIASLAQVSDRKTRELDALISSKVNHFDRTLKRRVDQYVQNLNSAETKKAIANAGLDVIGGFFSSLGEKFAGLVKMVYEWCKENYRVLIVTMSVIIVTAVISSATVPLDIFDVFGGKVVEVVQEDVAQSFGVNLGISSCMAWLKTAATHMRDCKTIMEGVKYLFETLVELVDYAWDELFGIPFTSKAKARKGILETVKVLSERLEEYDPSAPSDPQKDSAYVDAYRELLFKARLLTFDKNLHASVQALLSKYAQEYMNTMSRLSCGKTRVNPLCVFITGPPGSGKSTMVQPMIKSLYMIENDAEEFDPRWKYDWKSANEYQDTYDNQFAILMDDAFQMTEATVRMNEAMEIINLINTAPYPIHTAAVEKKGKTFCNSKVVILTSNDNKFHDVGLSDVSALKRRLHVKIYTRCEMEYLVDVEMLQGVVNGSPYWALYNAVKMEDLHDMLTAAYLYYREEPVSATVDLRGIQSVLRKKDPLEFNFEPTGYTRGDRVVVDLEELKATLASERRMKMPRKIPKSPTMVWKPKVKKVEDDEDSIELVSNRKEKKKKHCPDGSEPLDISQGWQTYQVCVVQRETPSITLRFDFGRAQIAQGDFAKFDPGEPFRQGTYCLDNVCCSDFGDKHSTLDEVLLNGNAVSKARRNFAKWFLNRRKNATEMEVIRGDFGFINPDESMDQEFILYLFARIYPERVRYCRAGEVVPMDAIPDDCVPKWQSVGRVHDVLKSMDLFALTNPELCLVLYGVSVFFGARLLVSSIISLATMALKKLGVMVDKPVDTAQSDDKFISRVQKQRAKQVRRAQNKHTKDNAQNLDTAPENVKSDLAKVVASSLPYSLTYEGETELAVQGGWLFFVRGGLAFTTLHGFERDSKGIFKKARGVAMVEQERLVFDPAVMQQENRLLVDEERDRLWLVLTGYSSVDNRRLFKDLQLAEPDNLMTISVDKQFATHSSFTTSVRQVGTHQYRHGEEVISNSGCFIADGIPGAAGDCGRIFLEKKENEIIIVGQHVAGGPSRSIVSHVTRKHVDDALSYFVKNLHERDRVHVCASEAMDVTQSGTIEPKIGSFQTWPVIGQSKKAHYSPSVSGFCESFYIDEHYGEPVFEVTMKPALLRARGEVDPVVNYSKHFLDKESKDYFPHMHDPEVWKGVFPKSAYHRKYRQFTFEEVVYTPTRVGLESICKKTSPGGKWVLIGVNRDMLLDPSSLWHGELKKNVYHIISCLQRGEIPFEFHILCAKDEPKSLEKVKLGDTRFFLIGSLEMQIVYRMYFGWFLVQQQINREEVDVQVGINPYSEEWNVLAQEFLGKRCSDADIKKWDVNYPRRIAYYMPYAAYRIWENVPYLEMQLLLLSVMQCRALIGNRLVLLFLLPSGFLLTAWLNSVVNSVGHRSIGKQIRVVLTTKVFGDDSVVGWSEFEEDDVLDRIIELRLKWYGWVSTSADKTGVPTVKKIEQCQFLKRGFIPDKSGRFVCPLDKSSIMKMLTWVQARTEAEMVVKTVQNISVAMMEASLHDEEYFSTLFKKLEGRWRDLAPKSFTPYDYTTMRFDTLHLENRLFH